MPIDRSTPLRYLSAADVVAALPPVEERLALARRTMLALVADAELPPKIAVHPRPDGSFGHAMPALLRGAAPDGSEDLMGMKWVTGFPTNPASGLPTIHGLVLMSDARTGLPRGVLDAGPITAHRTAAVSGVAIEHWAPDIIDRPLRIGLVGAGIQGGSHLLVLAHLLPGATLVIHDRDPVRAAALAAEAEAEDAFEAIATVERAVDAVEGADVVITLVSFGPEHQTIPLSAFGPDATIVAVDYDMCVPAALAGDAALFLVDDRGQYLANRTDRVFRGYPDPTAMIGEALIAGRARPATGRVLVTHLGVGLADVIFGDAVLRVAEAQDLGITLPR
jgi:ornithine cyclodeaminase/alanine dehydrogenase-like protein (mu-crystallin family)